MQRDFKCSISTKHNNKNTKNHRFIVQTKKNEKEIKM